MAKKGLSVSTPFDTSAIAPTIDGTDAGTNAETPPVITVQATRLGRFTLLRQLGQGGMGSVFAAYDEQLARRVAIKLLHQPRFGSTVQRQHTLREARAVARISHPNVISVYEVSESGEHIYIAMEFIEGESLLEWQSHGQTWEQILDMYLQAGAGLQAAHEAGVVHRDFKPDNALIGQDGRLRVIDFGLARVEGREPEAGHTDAESEPGAAVSNRARLTMPGIISGTPGYMSPEQYRGGNVGSASDQWSFCAALFEALYGYLPFPGASLLEKREGVHGPLLPPPSRTRVPEEIYAVLRRGLAVEPIQRFPTMAALLEALSLERGDQAAGSAKSRQRFATWFMGASILIVGVLQVLRSQRQLGMREVLFGSLAFLAILLGLGVYHRRTLLANRFHRYMAIILLLTSVENTCQRLFALKLGIAQQQLMPFEMVVLAANIGFAAAFLIPWLRWVPLLPLAAALLALSGAVSTRLLSLTLPIVATLFAIGWSRAARSVPTPRSVSQSGIIPILSLRSTPSALRTPPLRTSLAPPRPSDTPSP